MPVKDMQITKYDLNGNIISQVIEQENYEKSIYSNAKFMAKIPANKLKLIKVSTNDDIEQWVYMLPMQQVIDLSILPAWFTTGLDAMVSEGIFTQIQIDNFLEI